MLVKGMTPDKREEFDHMLTVPSPEEIREIARRSAAENASGAKQAPSWWTED